MGLMRQSIGGSASSGSSKSTTPLARQLESRHAAQPPPPPSSGCRRGTGERAPDTPRRRWSPMMVSRQRVRPSAAMTASTRASCAQEIKSKACCQAVLHAHAVCVTQAGRQARGSRGIPTSAPARGATQAAARTLSALLLCRGRRSMAANSSVSCTVSVAYSRSSYGQAERDM